MEKRPFDIGAALERIEDAVTPWPKAALFRKLFAKAGCRAARWTIAASPEWAS
jgi:hypothetical protein